jgi:hypothetical protein
MSDLARDAVACARSSEGRCPVSRLGRGTRSVVAALLSLSVFFVVELIGPPTARAALPTSVSRPIRLANEALTTTENMLADRKYGKALESLNTLRIDVRLANNAAIDQIGLPPPDPESDEPPGPAGVFAVLNLDHRVGMHLVVLFDGLTRADVVGELDLVLKRMHARRDAMLDAVIALPAEGARGDYDDGMSDTLTTYSAERVLLSTALQQYELTDAARVALTEARVRVRATQAKVTAVWGGGE